MTAGARTSPGAAFTAPDEGDPRGDPDARRRVSSHLGISPAWATVEQVHGNRAVPVGEAGRAGPADGLVTTVPGLPIAVFTADCLGVVLIAPAAVGVAHAGWRGLSAGILQSTMDLMERAGSSPVGAYIGPAIGPCCFEVGEEVVALFPEDATATTWGSPSVDLVGAARRRLDPLPLTVAGRCTACGGGPSHRATGTSVRMAAIGWIR
ncbi:MAG TPA: polyphenol oxidase family protein [Acidimicrobiia bacterium]|nr:polyphenol oxidase family protein [Acidimicrobiia bacterium]